MEPNSELTLGDRIMTAPFEDREGWEMTAMALDGSVYLELHDPPEQAATR
jgi:RAT1-interacting protein